MLIARKRAERGGLRSRKEALRQVVGIGNLPDQFDVDAHRATASKSIDGNSLGMREIEFQTWRTMHGRKSRLAVASLDQFDGPRGDVQAFGEEPPKGRASYDVASSMLDVAEPVGAMPLFARQQLPERRAGVGRCPQKYAYDFYVRRL